MADTAHPQAQAALGHAQEMLKQTDPAIWFDDWAHDLRDNDLDDVFDADDPEERAPPPPHSDANDGKHYNGPPGSPPRTPWPARVARGSSLALTDRLSTRHLPSWAQADIRVTYKVCVDVPLESYEAAGVPLPPRSAEWRRNVSALMHALSGYGWEVKRGSQMPGQLLDGDIVAQEAHHCGIVQTRPLAPSWVIHLPGPSTRRELGTVPGLKVETSLFYSPSGLNDMMVNTYPIFNLCRPVDCVARWTGGLRKK